MSKAKSLFMLAISALVAFLVQAISGLILWLALPHSRGVATLEGLMEVRLNQPLSATGTLGWTYTTGRQWRFW